jgi:hypothetical protein
MSKKKKSSPSNISYPVSQEKFPKIHPWRICPLGQHWVREHPRRVRPSRRHPLGGVFNASPPLDPNLVKALIASESDKEDISDPNLNIAAGVTYLSTERTLTLEAWELLENFTRGSSDET